MTPTSNCRHKTEEKGLRKTKAWKITR